MLQEITIIGYLGRDPEMRYLDTGTAVCDFSVATSRKYNRKSGDPVDETAWFTVTVWGAQAENAYKFLRKGDPVYIKGRIKPDESGNPRTFQRNDGTWGAKFEVTAIDVKYLPGGSGAPQGEKSSYQEVDDTPSLSPDDDDDDGSFIF